MSDAGRDIERDEVRQGGASMEGGEQQVPDVGIESETGRKRGEDVEDRMGREREQDDRAGGAPGGDIEGIAGSVRDEDAGPIE